MSERAPLRRSRLHTSRTSWSRPVKESLRPLARSTRWWRSQASTRTAAVSNVSERRTSSSSYVLDAHAGHERAIAE